MDGQSLLRFPVKNVKQNGLESFWLFGTSNQQVASRVRDDHLIARGTQERTRANRLKHNSGSRLAAEAAAAAVSTIFGNFLFIISWALRFSLARWDSQREPGETLRAAGESPTAGSRRVTRLGSSRTCGAGPFRGRIAGFLQSFAQVGCVSGEEGGGVYVTGPSWF